MYDRQGTLTVCPGCGSRKLVRTNGIPMNCADCSWQQGMDRAKSQEPLEPLGPTSGTKLMWAVVILAAAPFAAAWLLGVVGRVLWKVLDLGWHVWPW